MTSSAGGQMRLLMDAFLPSSPPPGTTCFQSSLAGQSITCVLTIVYIIYRLVRVSELHCIKNSNHIFPEMNLFVLVPNFYIHVSGSNFLYLHNRSYLESLFPSLCCVSISAQLQERREGQGTAAKQGLAAAPCPPLHACS